MAEGEWKVSKRSESCAECGRAFTVKEELISALFDGDASPSTATAAPKHSETTGETVEVERSGETRRSGLASQSTGPEKLPRKSDEEKSSAAEAEKNKKKNESEKNNRNVFTRRDYCVKCFREKPPAEVFSYWRTTVPDPEEEANGRRRPRVDVEDVFDFFRRLEGEREPQRAAFRFVLALMLTQKRVLKLEGTKYRKRKAPSAKREGAVPGDTANKDRLPTAVEEEEILIFTERASGRRKRAGGEVHEVVRPPLDEEALTAVSEEVGHLLGLPAPQKKKKDEVESNEEKKPETPAATPSPERAQGCDADEGTTVVADGTAKAEVGKK